jgi:type I restriction enzyme, S subunit
MNPAQLLAHFDRLTEAPDAIPRLRRFILDLAVRGKLVGQDTNDAPASELLKRIQAERTRLVKEEEVKRLDAFAPVEPEDIPFSIPCGWEVARMGWMARKLGAGSTPLGGKSVYQSEGVPFLRSQNVHNDGLRLDDVAFITRATHDRMSGTHVRKQDILLNITGASIGRCALVPETFVEGNVSQHVAIVRLFLPAIREFIHLSLTAPFFQKVIDDVQVGVSREGLSMQRLKLFPMLIPPLAEQHRIVAKVDELMALCDRLEAAQGERERRRDRLAAASLHRLNRPDSDTKAFRAHTRFHLDHLPRLTVRPNQIPALRQTILQQAFDGVLTSPSRFSLAPTALPPGWILRDIASMCVIEDGDRGSNYPKKQDFSEAGHCIFLNAKNVTRDGFAFSVLEWISKEKHQQLRKGTLVRGDIVFTSRGTIGNIAHYDNSVPFEVMRINSGMFILRGFAKYMEASFLTRLLRAPQIHSQIDSLQTGTAQPQLPIRDFRRFTAKIPPLAEQRRIVAKVDELMAVCDRLESQLTTAQTDSRSLLEAVLHEALASRTKPVSKQEKPRAKAGA